MTAGLAIATMVGAAMFPLFIRLVWGELVEDFGPIGGWMAAAFIVGTALVN
jgi:lmo0349 protein